MMMNKKNQCIRNELPFQIVYKSITMSHEEKEQQQQQQAKLVHPSDHLDHDGMIITRHFHTSKARPNYYPQIV